MKCPHCLENFHEEQQQQQVSLGSDIDGGWSVLTAECPACKRLTIHLLHGTAENRGGLTITDKWLVRPKGALRPPPSPEVPKNLSDDYVEACLVLPDSPKASAALSRRCLQHLLRDTVRVKHGNLCNEIQEVLDSGKLPSQLAESIDAIRNIGNFAAHPMKSQSTGEVLPVEPGEADWNLDVLEGLFDFYFVQPALLKKKKEELNKKLAAANKPPMR
jgi:hypothetical protein